MNYQGGLSTPQVQPPALWSQSSQWRFVSPAAELEITNPQDSVHQLPQNHNTEGSLRNWLVVTGAWCCIFVSLGWIGLMGVFQAYYETAQLRNNSKSVIAWIPSTQTFVLFNFAPMFGHIFDRHGCRPLLIGGTIFHIFGLLMLSLSTQFYQILLAQRLCSGIGASAIFWAASLAINTSFKKRRGLATGLAVSASSLGASAGSAVIPFMLAELGFSSTVKAIAFAYLCFLAVALATLRSKTKVASASSEFADIVALIKEERVIALSVTGFFICLGVYLPYDFVVTDGVVSGMSSTSANDLLVILTATGLVGRIGLIWASDYLGRFNVAILCAFVASLLILAMWLPSNSKITQSVFAALYGMFSAALVSSLSTLASQICFCDEKMGVYAGATFFIMSPGFLISMPIGGALANIDFGTLPYLFMKLFCGLSLCLAAILLVVTRAFYLKAIKNGDNSEQQTRHLNFHIALI